MKTKKAGSGTVQVYELLLVLGKQPETEFTPTYIRKKLSHLTAGQVDNALYRMRKAGGVVAGTTKGYYTVDLTKLKKWGSTRNWKNEYSRRKGPHRRTSVKKVSTDEVTVSESDADVLANLLNALVKAEPIIRKHAELAETLTKFK